jgi:hypothetical protein
VRITLASADGRFTKVLSESVFVEAGVDQPLGETFDVAKDWPSGRLRIIFDVAEDERGLATSDDKGRRILEVECSDRSEQEQE